SIFDQYVPDRLGAVPRAVQTVAAEGLFALATGVMLIRSGVAEVVACEAHSKTSDVLTLPDVVAFALDPVFERPLGVHPWFVAGLDMRRFLALSGATLDQCAEVVAKNRTNALGNPSAAYAASLTVADVAASPQVFEPLRELDCPRTADGAVVMVLAGEERARALCERPVWVDGVGWSTEAPSLSTRAWGSAGYARPAAARGAHGHGCRRRPVRRRKGLVSVGQKVAVVGAGMTRFVRRSLETGKELAWEAALRALESAELTLDDIDAVCIGSAPDAFDGVHMKGEYLADGSGGWNKPVIRSYVGGGTGVFCAIQGWYHVASGMFDRVLVVAEEKMSSTMPHAQGAFITIFDNVTERPLGPNLLWIFALEMNRY